MRRTRRHAKSNGQIAGLRLVLVVLALLVVRDAPAQGLHLRGSPLPIETPMVLSTSTPRVAAWAQDLAAILVTGVNTHEQAGIRLYMPDGEIDPEARATLERIAANNDTPHELAKRLEQLVFLAAYHFNAAPVIVVSAWRAHAGRHGTGEAMDFKLKGVLARELAAYLRSLPRAGVGIYTNPNTQFVHLDVREQSYHWIDASPPGVKWREGRLRDPGAEKRDAVWTPSMDLP
jgi:uncharacterized protein YcbK (DUF882 family)